MPNMTVGQHIQDLAARSGLFGYDVPDDLVDRIDALSPEDQQIVLKAAIKRIREITCVCHRPRGA